MVGIGIDIVEYEHVRQARFLPRVAEFVLSANEQEHMAQSPDAVQFFASRFAAKEAVIKAFPGKLSYRDFEIAKQGARPVVRFVTLRKSACTVAVSITHTKQYAAGFAIAYENPYQYGIS